jgi:hypothetical protein
MPRFRPNNAEPWRKIMVNREEETARESGTTVLLREEASGEFIH